MVDSAVLERATSHLSAGQSPSLVTDEVERVRTFDPGTVSEPLELLATRRPSLGTRTGRGFRGTGRQASPSPSALVIRTVSTVSNDRDPLLTPSGRRRSSSRDIRTGKSGATSRSGSRTPRNGAVEDASFEPDAPSPEWRVQVVIVGARSLLNVDPRSQGKSDPYCTCQVEGRPQTKFQTNVVIDNLDPVWNCEAGMECTVGDSLMFSVWDQDIGKQDDFLGQAQLASGQFIPTGFDGEIALDDCGNNDSRLTLRITVERILLETRPEPKRWPVAPVIRQPAAIAALKAEYHTIERELKDMCRVNMIDCDIFDWEAVVFGPAGTPYYGGTFRFMLSFPPDYPTKPPRVRCTTPVFHCNIDQNGTVCFGQSAEGDAAEATLSRSRGALGLLEALLSLLTLPFPENALVASAARLFLSDRRKHDRMAREWTVKYAL